jgi:VanZ family protein
MSLGERGQIRVLHALWYWGPVALYAGLIFYLSSQSHPERYVPSFLFLELGDKVLHAIEYAVLGFLCYRAFRHAAGSYGEHYAVMMAVGAATLYGATDEWHQAFVPFRESDRWDLATDLLGAFVGALAWAWIEQRNAHTHSWSTRTHAVSDRPTETSHSVAVAASKDVTLEPEAR